MGQFAGGFNLWLDDFYSVSKPVFWWCSRNVWFKMFMHPEVADGILKSKDSLTHSFVRTFFFPAMEPTVSDKLNRVVVQEQSQSEVAKKIVSKRSADQVLSTLSRLSKLHTMYTYCHWSKLNLDICELSAQFTLKISKTRFHILKQDPNP